MCDFQHFAALTRELGGDPETLLDGLGVSYQNVINAQATIPCKGWINLLDEAAEQLGCASFGLKLARIRWDAPILSPLEVVMHNSHTLLDAFRYCQTNMHLFSASVRFSMRADEDRRQHIFQYEIFLENKARRNQFVEHTVGITFDTISAISNHNVRPLQIWFAHDPLSSLQTYEQFFHVPVSFGMPINAIILKSTDLDLKIPNRNDHILEMATRFIDEHFPAPDTTMTARVEATIAKLLTDGRCNNESVADALGIAPRTLHRRLRDESSTFEDIKDLARRNMALHWLGKHGISLTEIAGKLGYSESSVLTRSCYRWFSMSPSNVRMQLRKEGPDIAMAGNVKSAGARGQDHIPALR